MTKKELIDYIEKNIKDIDILQQLENVLFYYDIEKLAAQIFIGKQIPIKAQKTIINFFLLNKSSIDDKKELIESLIGGMITKVSPGSYNSVIDMIDNKYSKITSKQIFKDFLKVSYPLTDAKDKQGATGTGRGEIMLALLGKDGKLPDKSDTEIAGKGIEVKASNGEIAGFKKVTPKDTEKYLKKHFGEYQEKTPDNFKDLCKFLLNYDAQKSKAFLIEYFNDRVTEEYLKPSIEAGIKAAGFNKDLQKNLLNSVGTQVFLGYKKLYKFSYILAFKDSKDSETKISIADSKANFLKVIKINGMNMKNGGRPAPLTVNVK